MPLKLEPMEDPALNLTPMVDVVFQLLIFFMVTASFALHKTIESPTPEAARPADEEGQRRDHRQPARFDRGAGGLPCDQDKPRKAIRLAQMRKRDRPMEDVVHPVDG